MASSRMKGDSLRRVLQLMLLVMPFLLHVSVAQNCGTQASGAVCQQSGYCCSTFGYCGNTDAYCGAGNCQSQCPSSPSPGGGGSGVGSIVTSSRFDQIFPNRNSFYTYSSFISAANSFPAFGTTGDSSAQGQEIAAFFAHVTLETGGLQYISETNPQSDYCDPSNTQYPCASGKEYYGRGPLQISWNYNYGPAGEAIGQDLLSNPDLVAQDPTVAFKTALWFWTTAQSPKPSCHDVMVGNWNPSSADVAAGRQPGFGVTIDIINGGKECGSGATNPDSASSRVSSYQSICSIFGVTPGSNLVCTNMQPWSS